MNEIQLQLLSLHRRQFLKETELPLKGTPISIAVESYYRCNNWEGLLLYLENLDAHQRLIDDWKWQIGQMHIYTGEPEKAIEYLFPIHCQSPYQPEVQLTISEALCMMGRSCDQFEWVNQPDARDVIEDDRLNCLHWIKEKGKALPLYFLQNRLFRDRGVKPYRKFDLVMALKQDPRFKVINSTPFYRYSFVDINTLGGAAENAAPRID